MEINRTYSVDLTKDEVSYLLELLNNEQYSANTNAPLAKSLSNSLDSAVMFGDLNPSPVVLLPNYDTEVR